MPSTKETAPHLEELLRALGNRLGTDVTAEDVEAEFERYLDHGVPPDQAKVAILRSLGVSPRELGGGSDERTKLEELKPNLPFVTIVARVAHIEQREITVKGEPRQITSGILSDETMSRGFTAWRPVEFAKGDTVSIRGAYTREYRGEPEIQLGDRAEIVKVEADALPAGADSTRPFQIGDLKPGLRNVDITARILTVGPKSVMVKETPKTVYSGTLGDGTGKVSFSAWHDFSLKEGQIVRIRGANVKGWRGTSQLSFDNTSTVEVVPEGSFPSGGEIDQAGPVPIGHFIGGGGALDVTLEATVLEVRPGSGLVTRCTQCSRVLKEGACSLHGKVEGRPDLRIKAILDDGTGALTALLNRALTEQILGKDLPACEKLAQEGGTPDVVVHEIRQKILARPYRMRGNVLKDAFGPMLIAHEAIPVQRDLAAAAEALLAEIGEAA